MNLYEWNKNKTNQKNPQIRAESLSTWTMSEDIDMHVSVMENLKI